MADLPDHDSATKETENGKHDIANNGVVDWSAITVDGINEEMFVRRMSIDNLEYVAQELQTLMLSVQMHYMSFLAMIFQIQTER